MGKAAAACQGRLWRLQVKNHQIFCAVLARIRRTPTHHAKSSRSGQYQWRFKSQKSVEIRQESLRALTRPSSEIRGDGRGRDSFPTRARRSLQAHRSLLPQAPERRMGERLPGGCFPSENFSADTDDGGSRKGAALARALRATLQALLPVF